MELLDFIHEHDNWRDLIQEAPYCIKIKEDDKYLLLKYNYYADETDWANPIVKQCRGIILRKDDLQPVCIPFYRFYNLGQKEADEVDFNNCKIQDKVDGSLIKIWIDDEKLHISTNGTINAYDVQLATLGGVKSEISFGTLVEKLIKDNIDLFYKDKNSTHMFELISPYNKVVVDYWFDVKLYYLGSRDNNSFKEYNNKEMRKAFPTVEEFNLNIIKADELHELANNRPEGIVVVDNNYNRVKVKNPQYLILSKSVADLTDKTILEIVARKNEDEFFATVKDIYAAQRVRNMSNKFLAFVNTIEKDRVKLKEKKETLSKKDYALIVLQYPNYEIQFLFDFNKNIYDYTLKNIKKVLKILKEYY